MSKRALCLIALLSAFTVAACKKPPAETETKSDKSSDDDEGSGKKKTKKAKKGDDEEASEESEKPAKGGCKFISEKDLSEVLGHPIKFRPGDDTKTCNWDHADEAKGSTGFIGSITVHEYNAAAWDMLNKKSEPVEDIGEKAAWGMGLMVKKGDKTLQVVMMKISGKKNEARDKAIEVAKKVLPKV